MINRAKRYTKQNKFSLEQIVIKVLNEAKKSLTIAEIYFVICEKKLFRFKGKTPKNTLHSQITRSSSSRKKTETKPYILKKKNGGSVKYLLSQ